MHACIKYVLFALMNCNSYCQIGRNLCLSPLLTLLNWRFDAASNVPFYAVVTDSKLWNILDAISGISCSDNDMHL